MAVDYGTDLSWTTDLDPTGRMATGTQVVAESVYRRLLTPRGACLDAPDDGLDVRAFLLLPLTPANQASIPGQIRQEILKDERVESAVVSADFTAPGTIGLTIRCTLVEAEDVFELVLSVTEAAALLL